MRGSSILVRSLSHPAVRDDYGNVWQYHSRSDRHSKIACWGVLFDLLITCPLLKEHAATGKIGFGINHEMRDFTTGRKKDLDLVICTPGTEDPGHSRRSTFAGMAVAYDLDLLPEDRQTLEALPILRRVPVGSVHVALEAKACMTAHVKALPRLYDELNSSHLVIHGASNFSIAAGYTIVNAANRFLSSDRNRFSLADHEPCENTHRQPSDCVRVIEKIKEIPRRAHSGSQGFDALGIVVIDFDNDGTPIRLVQDHPSPAVTDFYHYDQMIRRLAHLYESRFPHK
ncbi:MAG: hypothetical protein IT495_00070 [Gammaproteobacteria bacterium]|nr:hypothetical protein [Gammaproteobacteria bacterium]